MAVTMNAQMLSGRDVYFGPGGSATYEKVGSVSANENVKINWKEGAYYNITYVVDSTQKYKTGYVPASSVSCNDTNLFNDNTAEVSRNMRTSRKMDASYNVYYRAVMDEDERAGYIADGDSYWLVYTAGTDDYYSPYWKYIQYKVDSTGKYKRGWAHFL